MDDLKHLLLLNLELLPPCQKWWRSTAGTATPSAASVTSSAATVATMATAVALRKDTIVKAQTAKGEARQMRLMNWWGVGSCQ